MGVAAATRGLSPQAKGGMALDRPYIYIYIY